MYNTYLITEHDAFSPEFYPDIVHEVGVMREQYASITSRDKSRVIISMLRDHCVNAEWLETDAFLIRSLISSSKQTVQLEALFDASRGKRSFQIQLEAYVIKKLEA